jgi:hypothetical protein
LSIQKIGLNLYKSIRVLERKIEEQIFPPKGKMGTKARVSLTIQEKNELRIYAKKNPALSKQELTLWAREKFEKDVGFSTVSKISSSGLQLVHNPDTRRERRGRNPAMEAKLYEFIRKCEDESCLSDQIIFLKANDLLNKSGSNATVSISWVQKFKKRFAIKFRKRHGEAASANVDDVSEERQKLQDLIDQYKPSDV